MDIDIVSKPAPAAGRLRFLLVNNRTLRGKAECALCGTKLEQSYVREFHASVLYCDPQCLAGHHRITTAVKMAS